MNLIQFEAFVETVKTGSITASANSLGYTQPAFSLMISKLEQEFGFQLLFRNKRGVVPTEAGWRIYNYCQDILDKVNDLRDIVYQINGSIIGTLRIGSYRSVLARWIPDIINTMKQHYPHLELHLFEGNKHEQLSMLEENIVDIGIFSNSAPNEYHFIPLHEDPAVVILPKNHELCKKTVLSNSDLLHYPIIIQNKQSDALLKAVIDPQQYAMLKKTYVVKSDWTVLKLVQAGIGLGVIGDMIVTPTDNVEIRKIDTLHIRRIGLAIPRWKPFPPSLRCFVRIICDLFQDQKFLNSQITAI